MSLIKPKYLYRSDDGERFTLQKSGRYKMDKSGMNYTYGYHHLIRCGFLDSLDKCKIVEYKESNDGHGNGDFD